MKTVTYDEALFQLVPKEPTEAMLDAAFGPVLYGGRDGPINRDILERKVFLAKYRAFIAAAPDGEGAGS